MSLDHQTIVSLTALPPVSSQEQFASFMGTTKDTVRGFVETDALPHVKIGRQRFINVVKFVADLQSGKTVFTRGDYSND